MAMRLLEREGFFVAGVRQMSVFGWEYILRLVFFLRGSKGEVSGLQRRKKSIYREI